MKYRTKPVDPVVVDAVKYDGNLTLPAVEKDFDENKHAPEWVAIAFLKGKLYTMPSINGGKSLYARNTDGDMEIKKGFYIVMTDEGEIFGCRADVFEEAYEEMPNVIKASAYIPIRRMDEILLLEESQLSPQEKERVSRFKKIPENVREGYKEIHAMLNREVLQKERLMDAISDYLDGFTESVLIKNG